MKIGSGRSVGDEPQRKLNVCMSPYYNRSSTRRTSYKLMIDVDSCVCVCNLVGGGRRIDKSSSAEEEIR